MPIKIYPGPSIVNVPASAPGQINVDATNVLPMEIIFHIFSFAKANLLSMALVNRTWKNIIYEPMFYQRVVPRERCGREAWIKSIGDPGEEPVLPLSIFKDMDSGPGWLTLIPETILISRNGIVMNLQINPITMGVLAQNPKEGHKTGYDMEIAWKEAIMEQWPSEKKHWVWIRDEYLGHGKKFEEQRTIAKDQSKAPNATNGANVSGFLDTIVTMFMEKIRTGKDILNLRNQFGCPYTEIRVKEQRNNIPIAVSYWHAGLRVVMSGCDSYYFPVLAARKSFGRGIPKPA